MKITEIKHNKNQYLYEGLTPKYQKTMMLWESIGHTIVEAQMSPEDITKLFQQVEQSATDAGGNRTLVGQGKDAATAVANAYKDLKSKVENSAVMQNFDQMYDQAAKKLKQATGGDQGAMQYVEKYRAFAKKHPVAQSLIYGALIAAAGVSGAGAGGAAALGLLKMTDKLLQGEKFSSAAIKGAETGALAYGASKIGDMVRGGDTTTTTTTNYSQQYTGLQSDLPSSASGFPQSVLKQYPTANFDYKSDGEGYWEIFDKAGNKLRNVNLSNMDLNTTGAMESRVFTKLEVASLFESIVIQEELWNKFKQRAGAAVTQVVGATPGQIAGAAKGAAKGAVSAAGQKLAQVGKNITTKVTADKLQSAWQAAGSPTDSEAIADILQAQGVDPTVVNSAFQSVNVNRIDRTKLPDVSTLTAQQKQQLLAQLDALDQGAPATKTRTGGKVAGQVSQTPNAIRKRDARLAAKVSESIEYNEFKTKLRKALNR